MTVLTVMTVVTVVTVVTVAKVVTVVTVVLVHTNNIFLTNKKNLLHFFSFFFTFFLLNKMSPKNLMCDETQKLKW